MAAADPLARTCLAAALVVPLDLSIAPSLSPTSGVKRPYPTTADLIGLDEVSPRFEGLRCRVSLTCSHRCGLNDVGLFRAFLLIDYAHAPRTVRRHPRCACPRPPPSVGPDRHGAATPDYTGDACRSPTMAEGPLCPASTTGSWRSTRRWRLPRPPAVASPSSTRSTCRSARRGRPPLARRLRVTGLHPSGLPRRALGRAILARGRGTHPRLRRLTLNRLRRPPPAREIRRAPDASCPALDRRFVRPASSGPEERTEVTPWPTVDRPIHRRSRGGGGADRDRVPGPRPSPARPADRLTRDPAAADDLVGECLPAPRHGDRGRSPAARRRRMAPPRRPVASPSAGPAARRRERGDARAVRSRRRGLARRCGDRARARRDPVRGPRFAGRRRTAGLSPWPHRATAPRRSPHSSAAPDRRPAHACAGHAVGSALTWCSRACPRAFTPLRYELVDRPSRRGRRDRRISSRGRGRHWGWRASIGRAAERELLAEAYARAVAGDARTVVIAGEAGDCKSRLVNAFAELVRADGARVLMAVACHLGPVGCRTVRSSRRCGPCCEKSIRSAARLPCSGRVARRPAAAMPEVAVGRRPPSGG